MRKLGRTLILVNGVTWVDSQETDRRHKIRRHEDRERIARKLIGDSDEGREKLGKKVLQTLVQGLPLAFVVIDPEGKVKLWNSSAERLFGRGEQDVLDKHIFDVAKDHQVLRALGEAKVVEKAEAGLGFRSQNKDGSMTDLYLWAAPLIDTAGQTRGTIGLIADMTWHKQPREKVSGSERMEAVERLAGGVAHNFNNLLTAIIGYSQLLLTRLGQNDPLRSNIEIIENAARQAAVLANHLLDFSCKQIVQPRVFDINAVVINLDKVLRHILGEDVKLVTILRPGLGRVKADPKQIERVLMHLASNARDAMPQGGTLTIKTADVHLDEESSQVSNGVRPGPYVMLTMKDTGVGIDEETQSKIFEPFFTTKEHSRRTGLGLSSVYGIIKQSGGHVSVSSAPGRGTSISIYLPRSHEPLG